MMRRFVPLLLAAIFLACGDSDPGTTADATGDLGAPDVATTDTAGGADSQPGPDAAGPDTPGTPDGATPDSAADGSTAGPDVPADTGAPQTSGPQLTELGTIELDPSTGLSAPLTLTLPSDAVSLAITALGATGIGLSVEDLRAPDSQVLMPLNWTKSPQNGGGQVCVTCLNRASSAQAASATMVPMAPTLSVAPGGTYTFRVFGYTTTGSGFFQTQVPYGGPIQVGVTWKEAPGAALPPDGVIDLNLHFTGSDGLNAGGAPFDTRIKKALADFEAAYAQAGIRIGRITYRDIDPIYQVVDGYLGPDNDFEAAARQTAGSPPGINLIFVREILDTASSAGAFGFILGISGGIPGPIGYTGNGRSAVIIDGSPPAGTGDSTVGLTMAHEVGHFLGLFHSSEFPSFNQLHDPIPDTPENDTSNLMYFEGGSAGAKLSPQQSAVMRGNPWIRNVEEDAK
ncbi:MAG: hypothetical protein H6744_12700 [Deltaproteobacteria bacterium]|nr:hypothetical protein [Deltaproteobacteria bacterium]MCB9787532.1 hypothetical protein [Deltaproteobacteria bacterium]